MAAGVVAAEHYDAVHAGCAHFAEGDFLQAVRQKVPTFARWTRPDPLSDIEEMRHQFHHNLLLVQGAESEDRAELLTALVRGKVDQNLDAIRERVLRNIEIEAAQAGKKN
jgi:hypothetical protein